VRLGGGATLSYDRLVVTVGSTIRAGAIEPDDEAAMQVMPHAWKARRCEPAGSSRISARLTLADSVGRCRSVW